MIWVNKQEIGYEPEQLLAYMLPELCKARDLTESSKSPSSIAQNNKQIIWKHRRKDMKQLYESLGISKEVYEYGEGILEALKVRFAAIDETAEYNQLKGHSGDAEGTCQCRML